MVLRVALGGLAVSAEKVAAVAFARLGAGTRQLATALTATSAQRALPTGIGARGVAVPQVAELAGLALGSAPCGAADPAVAPRASAAASVALAFLGLPFQLALADDRSLQPTGDSPTHTRAPDPAARSRRGAVQVERDLGSVDRGARARRLVEGGFDWGPFEREGASGALVETFASADRTEHRASGAARRRMSAPR